MAMSSTSFRALSPLTKARTWQCVPTSPKCINWANYRSLSTTRPVLGNRRRPSGPPKPPSDQWQYDGKSYGYLQGPDIFGLGKKTPGYVHLNVHEDGRVGNFGPFWLRDNCQCSKCIHPDTRQRNVNTFSIPSDINVKDIRYVEGGAEIEWTDGHHSFYPYVWLLSHRNYPFIRRKRQIPKRLTFRPFKAHEPGNDQYPTVSYENVMSGNEALLEWLENIYVYGFCFVKGVPVNPESTQTLLERIAFIRNTHYGGFWDFTADMTFKDTAYTTEFLGAHTDNTYFTDPARLQLFHLLSHTDGKGGESLLVDGFQAARTLRDENPDHLDALVASKHPFHASGNEDTVIQPTMQRPVLAGHEQRNRLYQIRWNNYDRAAKRDWNLGEQEEWHAAARHFYEIIRRPQSEIWTQLEPGTALIFDNWRMLHGRSEFTGKRRMCGGYINHDDFISRYRLLKFGRENVLQHLGDFSKHKNNPNYYF